MDKHSLYYRWRFQILKVSLIAAIIIFCIEFISIFSYYGQGITSIDTSISRGKYILFYFCLPTVSNFLSVFICYLILKSERFSEKIKNYTSILSVTLVAAFTMCVHHVFPPLICSMSVILPLTTIFGDRKMTRFFYLLSYPLIAVSFVFAYYGYTKDDPHLFYNLVVGIALVNCAYFGSIAIVKFQKERLIEIEESYHKQVELKEQLKLDQLTSLYNHSAIHQIIQELVEEYLQGMNKSLHLAIVDIDDFKKVNDTYGHVNGDVVLRRLSALFKRYENEQIIVSRYGGEEFAIAFVNMEIDDVLNILKAMLKEFNEMHFGFSNDCHISFSCGLAEYCDSKWSSEYFFEVADKALYISKSKGKNCITLSEDWGPIDE